MDGTSSESSEDFPIAGASMAFNDRRKKSLSAAERRKRSMGAGESRRRSTVPGACRKGSVAPGITRQDSFDPNDRRKSSVAPLMKRQASLDQNGGRKGSIPSSSSTGIDSQVSVDKLPVVHTQLTWDLTAKMAKAGIANKKTARGLRILMALDKHDWQNEAFECKLFFF